MNRHQREFLEYAINHKARWALIAAIIIFSMLWAWQLHNIIDTGTFIGMIIWGIFGYLAILYNVFIPRYNEKISQEIQDALKQFQGTTPRVEDKKLIFENENGILELEIIEYFYTRREWP